MSKPAAPDDQGTSTRPYLIRALHDWCTDNGFTPYIAVHVGPGVQVPMEYVKNNEIVLNIGFEATSGMKLGNEYIEFRARFGGQAREIMVPVDHVVAIYARENGQGMAFPVPTASAADADTATGVARGTEPPKAGLRLASGGDEAAPEPTPPVLEAATDGDEATRVAEAAETTQPAVSEELPPPEPPAPPAPGGRPALKRVK